MLNKLADIHNVDMPITSAVNDLIESKISLKKIIQGLLNRPIKEEK